MSQKQKVLTNNKTEIPSNDMFNISVKLFTIVKDEVDIIDDWIKYHGNLFGYNNLYIIDNYSTDGTWEQINEYSSLINIFREKSYSNKGLHMSQLINKFCKPGDIAYPIDIDEFIVYYNDEYNSVSTDKTIIHDYLSKLPKTTIYKTNYIMVLPVSIEGHDKITHETNFGTYNNYGITAKSFFNTKYYNGYIDHGNHIPINDYHLTKLCLVHYHFRNLEQIKKKTLNNVIGLGHKNNLSYLTKLMKINPNCAGNHHVKCQIQILEGTFTLPFLNDDHDTVNITELKETIKSFFTSS